MEFSTYEEARKLHRAWECLAWTEIAQTNHSISEFDPGVAQVLDQNRRLTAAPNPLPAAQAGGSNRGAETARPRVQTAPRNRRRERRPSKKRPGRSAGKKTQRELGVEKSVERAHLGGEGLRVAAAR